MKNLTRFTRVILLSVITFVFASTNLYAGVVAVKFCYKGEWSGPKLISLAKDMWNEGYYVDGVFEIPVYGCNHIGMLKNGSGLVLTSRGGMEFFRFSGSYAYPSKDRRKQLAKTGHSIQYTGTVEYYVNDERPTAEAIAKDEWFVIPSPRHEETPSVKRQAKATIYVWFDKDQPIRYEVVFDNIHIHLQLQDMRYNL